MKRVEIIPCSKSDVVEEILKYKRNTLSRAEAEKKVESFLFECFSFVVDGVKEGVVFSTRIGNVFTVDGYYSGSDIISAIKAGREFCNRTLENTKEIWTSHRREEKSVTAMMKRIGFHFVGYVDENIVLVMRS